MHENFIVAIWIGEYLKNFSDITALVSKSGAKPRPTRAPSYATAFEYVEADQIARILRRGGYNEAHVCTIYGMPATLEAIAENMK